MIPRRHLPWLIAALAFGAVVLPILVYYTGSATLGAYAHGGLGTFLGDYFADLARLRGSAWALFLGPLALVLIWRFLVAYAWRRGAD